MEREIKFMAKRLDNGDWCDGNLFVGEIPNGTSYTLIGNEEGNIEVDPDTICQFTGAKDANNAELYEHDIIHYKGYSNKKY